MHLGLCSLLFAALLQATLNPTLAITGCIVTLMNPSSIRRKVLCMDPKEPIESIPLDLPQSTEMLLIWKQNISVICETDFTAVSQMTHLQLTSSNLRRIHKNSLKGLSRLLELDLSGNMLTISHDSLPLDIFSSLTELTHLRLSGNPLGLIPDLWFNPMALNLRKLYLNRCDQPPLRIAPRAFKGLVKLEDLDLRDSGLQSLLPPMEADLRDMKMLVGLYVSGNLFLCDCNLRWFYFYLNQMQDAIHTIKDGDREVRCSSPKKLFDRRFPLKDDRLQLKYTDFVCPPKCSVANTIELVLEIGSSVNLTCDCFTDPIQRLIWTKNKEVVEETVNKYKVFHKGAEKFQSTMNIVSLRTVDNGNWSCKLDSESFQHFSLKVRSSATIYSVASINVYILVGLGSSLFLICLVVIMIVMFCRREAICNLRNQHPMVICGYETNMRKTSMIDGDLQYHYNQQDGRFNTSFYENTIPFDSSLPHYQRANHLYPDDLLSDKSYSTKGPDLKTSIPKFNTDKMLNVYCGCNYNSEDLEAMTQSFTHRSRSSKTSQGRSKMKDFKGLDNSDESFLPIKLRSPQDIEKLIPNMKQCPFHGSSGTLTRIPGHKPCPVHGSTSTLPSRLSSKKREHRSDCPKHNKDNISVKSLKLDSSSEDRPRPHRCKSVGRISTKFDTSLEKLELLTPTGYKPCPLHGDILTAINENLFEPVSNHNGNRLASITKTHSKSVHDKTQRIPALGCDKIGRKPKEILKGRNDLFQLSSSINISQTLTSPVQSSLSSSPLLTSDVHGTLV